MKIKKIFACILMVCIIFSNINIPIYANSQKPVENLIVETVGADRGFHPITNKLVLYPKVKIKWDNPANWDVGLGGADIHPPTRYLINIQNTNDAADKKTVTIPYVAGETGKTVELDKHFTFRTGALYSITVIPEHTHIVSGTPVPIQSTGNTTVYALTDVNVEMESSDTDITVKWDDVGIAGCKYKITYAQIDYDDTQPRSVFENCSKKYSFTVDKSACDIVPGTNQLKYKISGTIEPAKPYSVTVEPLLVLAGKTITRNFLPNIYKTHTRIAFKVLEDGDFIRFEWDINDTFMLNGSRNVLQNTKIVEFVDGSVHGQTIVEFPGKNGASLHFYKIKKKTGNLKYQLVLTYENYYEDVKSDKIPFLTSGVLIEPLKPEIPLPLSENIKKQLKAFYEGGVIEGNIKEELEQAFADEGTREKAVQKVLAKYLVKGDKYDVSTLDGLLADKRGFQVDTTSNTINLAWTSFRRKDYDKYSPTFGKYITDFDVYYDIWITDQLGGLNTVKKAFTDLQINKNVDIDKMIISKGDVIGFKHSITQYVDANTNTLKNIQPNKLYYIKILAKKKSGTDEVKSDQEIKSIYFNYNGDVFTPPVMARPPLKIVPEKLLKDSAVIQWRREWYEVISKDPTGELKNWYHQVWAEKGGKIYKDKADNRTLFRLDDLEDVKQLIDFVGVTNFNTDYIYRAIDLGANALGASDVNYEFVRLKYTDVQAVIEARRVKQPNYSLDNYLKDLVREEKEGITTINWKNISPTQDAADNKLLNYKEEGLRPNKSYVFLIRPYRQIGAQKLMAFYPSALVVSTPDDVPAVTPTPPVPYLEVKDMYSDSEIQLIWDYDKQFAYELKYSKIDDIDKAEELPWDILDEYDKEEDIPAYISDYTYEEKDLFPDTTYYFWIRAKSKKDEKKVSRWSNSVIGRTKDLESPIPPRGIGKGTKSKLIEHDIKDPIGKDYLTIQWILDSLDDYGKDKEEGSDKKRFSKSYAYILEYADNAEFLDAITMNITNDNVGGSAENNKILDKNLVQINDLISNKVYYIRMKTKVIFKDSKGDRTIEKESEYSTTIWLITKWTGSEYDGTKDPSKEILPENDYELIYDKVKQTLTYRFRYDDKGDNNTDQRLIADLISKNKYKYTIDVSEYMNKPIKSRIIKMNDGILKAFDEYKVDVVINAGDIVIDIPYQSFANAEYNYARKYGDNPEYVMTVDKVVSQYELSKKPKNADKLLSDTQRFNVTVLNDMLSYDINYTEKLFQVKLRPASRFELYDKQADTYEYDYKKSTWNRTNGVLEKRDGLMTFDTGVVGKYAIYSTEDKVTKNITHWSEAYRKSLLKKVNVIGIDNNYEPNNQVKSNKLINMVSGIVEGEKDIDLNKKINSNKITQLVRAGLVKEGRDLNSKISRRESIEMFIKAYEIINGEPIYYSKDKEVVSAKAYNIGLIEKDVIERPQAPLSYGEMFFMADMITK